MGASATLRGGDLLKRGFSIAQVVQDYGDICQAITELALDLGIPVATEDFQTLNRCLDNAIANAVTEYARQSDLNISGAVTERQGIFAHELRNHLNTAPSWPDSVPVVEIPDTQTSPVLAAEPDGGAIFAWADGRNTPPGPEKEYDT